MNLNVSSVSFKSRPQKIDFVKSSENSNEFNSSDVVDFEYKPLTARGINEYIPGIILSKDGNEAEVAILKGRDKGEIVHIDLNNSDYRPVNVLGSLDITA
ncbi:MAG TPA: hypothetical protein PLG15_03715 [Candidatus Gastranaerophilaceae bacterium]|nr:hypothetical protein [Candidatus Gastranaerophilaceae bacterium]HPT41472.1 hypothetical protein [Candidatus Gastranaerophilaceae bacterium]